MRIFRLGAFVMAAVMLFFHFSLTVRGVQTGSSPRNEKKTALSLSCNVFDDGCVEVLLKLTSDGGICGLFGEICFDSSAFVLLSCGNEDSLASALDFSYREREGRVVFLLDGAKNCEPDCILASFYFKKSTELQGSFDFSFSPIGARSCFWLYSDEVLYPIAIDATECKAVAKFEEFELPAAQPHDPRLAGVETSNDGESLWLCLRGEMLGKKHFAAGFRVFAVELDSAKTTRVVTSKIVMTEKYKLAVYLPYSQKMCIIVTPVAYNGQSVIEGDKQIFVFGRFFE